MKNMEIEGKNNILLLIDRKKDSNLVKNYLSPKYNIISENNIEKKQIDLILTDPSNLEKYKEFIKEKKESNESIFLPCLLITKRQEKDLNPKIWEYIDDVIPIPIPKAFLKNRIENLLDRRQKSIEIINIKENLETRTYAIDKSPVGVVLTDPNKPDNPLVYVNKRFEKMTGYDLNEILGKNCRFLQGPETDPEKVNEIKKAIEEKEPISVDLLNYRKDGTPFWNNLTISPVKKENGEVIRYIGFQKDITDKKYRQKELERYERIIEASGDPVYTLDKDGNYTYVNEKLTEMTGYSKEKLIGSHASLLYSDIDIDRSERLIEELLKNKYKNTDTIELELETKSGSYIPIEAHIALLPFDNGEFQGTTGVLRDISERKKRESRLEVLTRVLRHDLLNTMNIILTRAEILRDLVPENEQNQLDTIIDNVNKLVDISRKSRDIEELIKRDEVIKESIDIVSVIKNRVEILKDSYPSAKIEVDLLDEAFVLTNDLISSAIDNLIENAIQHNPKPDPYVKVSVYEEKNNYVVEIEDNGPGIPREEINTLKRGTETDLDHLSGLGLWIIHWVIEESEGKIDFKNKNEDGTCILIKLRKPVE